VQDLPVFARVVTLKGEVFTGTGLVVAGQENRSAVVARPRQKQELQTRVEELEDRVNDLDKQDYSINQKLTAARETQHSLEAQLKAARADVNSKHAGFQAAALTLEQVKQKQEWQKGQLTSLNDQLSRVSSELAELQQSLEENAAKMNALNQKVQEFTQNLNTLPMDDLQAEVVHWNTSLAVTARSVKEANRRYDDFLAVVNAGNQNRVKLTERINNQDLLLDQLVHQKEELHLAEASLNQQIDLLQEKITPAESELVSLDNEYARLQQEYSSFRQAEANADRFNTQAQLEMSRIRESLDTLRRRIEEDFGLVALEYSENITGPTPLPLDGVDSLPVVKEISPELEEAINRQRAQLKRMGAVNPEAKRNMKR